MLHDFYLCSTVENPDYDYRHNYDREPDVKFHDELIMYISDSLKWIEAFNPAMRMGPQNGLNYYGVTALKSKGAGQLAAISEAWANLFRQSPETLYLTGDFQWTEGTPFETGRYATIETKRDEVIARILRLREVCLKVESSSNSLYILHHGL